MWQPSLAKVARETIAFAKKSSASTESVADVFVFEHRKVRQCSTFDGPKVEHKCLHLNYIYSQLLPSVIYLGSVQYCLS